MPYNYKGYTLPVHKDKNWHEYVDPFFRALIDKDEVYNSNISELYTLIIPSNNYIIEQYEELNTIIYSLRVYLDNWNVYKVTNNNSIYTTEIADINNNPLITDKNIAWVNRYTLVYS